MLDRCGKGTPVAGDQGTISSPSLPRCPLFWLFAEAAVNPKYIAEYAFPGVITGYFTHLEYVKLAP